MRLDQHLATLIVALGVPIYLGVNVGWVVAVIAFFASWIASFSLGLLILYYAPEGKHQNVIMELLGFAKLAVIGFAAYYLGTQF